MQARTTTTTTNYQIKNEQQSNTSLKILDLFWLFLFCGGGGRWCYTQAYTFACANRHATAVTSAIYLNEILCVTRLARLSLTLNVSAKSETTNLGRQGEGKSA